MLIDMLQSGSTHFCNSNTRDQTLLREFVYNGRKNDKHWYYINNEEDNIADGNYRATIITKDEHQISQTDVFVTVDNNTLSSSFYIDANLSYLILFRVVSDMKVNVS